MSEVDTGSHTYGDPGYPEPPGAFRIVEGPDPALLAVLERIAVALEKIAQDTEPTHIISGGDLHLGILRES